MRKIQLSATTLLVVGVFILTARPVLAATPERCGWTPRSVAAVPPTDEARVADWIVARILKLAADSGPVVEFSPREVAAATGVDMTRVDADEVAQQVRERLRELSRRPIVEHQSAPESSAVRPVPHPAAEPEPASAPAETTGGVPESHD